MSDNKRPASQWRKSSRSSGNNSDCVEVMPVEKGEQGSA